MLPRQVLDVLGAGLVALGLFKYWASSFAELDAVFLGLALGAGTIAAGRIGGGPQPVPEGGYDFPSAMKVLRRATWGSLMIGSVLTIFPFYLWVRGDAGPIHVLFFFGLSLLIAYASLVAAAGLVVVDVVTRKEEGRSASEGPEPGA
ncbi:MAG: hypothetical protein R3185_04985 [Candidatus Thermoplasmatota archaeon]|nr:hypothetical protein [Candidatus Thermoplasmatota archaeon]